MAYRLPPLNTLRLFEAAGRHLSFKLAAEELNLTPSAVSHGIQTLEDWLGVPLFARGHRAIALTIAGHAYLPRVREALHTIAAATEGVPGRAPSGRLAVSVAPSFGLRWLLPRLPRFQAAHPEIEVQLDTAHRQVEFPRDGIDVAIRRGVGGWPAVDAVRLAAEDLVPVAAPAVAAMVRTAADLRRRTLLHVVTVPEDWDAWARLKGIGGLDTGRGLRFDTIHMATEAAVQGLGVVVGRLPLVAAEMAAGRLVPVLGPPVASEAAYWLVTAPDALRRPDVAAFRRWIASELAPPQPVESRKKAVSSASGIWPSA
ncbi:transcriptional regulator GcvA [Caenispirillum bisanense]|uniref:DNA-binding transcriptional regulator, LysR family n=1 Tax=Caenispirillum bisanense TaxID=414052 RepID=A0A286GAS0_9PROT|nr:transcriptional regulator GcvA [Caenispirillum bisanense]SOD92617.1 DNA-binding transcriptional regulator, LysR family [Caenispirillum bisanense]